MVVDSSCCLHTSLANDEFIGLCPLKGVAWFLVMYGVFSSFPIG